MAECALTRGREPAQGSALGLAEAAGGVEQLSAGLDPPSAAVDHSVHVVPQRAPGVKRIGRGPGGVLQAGGLEIRPADGLVLATGRPLVFSVREFELLVALVRREGTIATREELYGEAWQTELKPGDRSVDVYVSRLRRKLEDAMPGSRYIHTHPGFGYRFQAER